MADIGYNGFLFTHS